MHREGNFRFHSVDWTLVCSFGVSKCSLVKCPSLKGGALLVG